MKGLRCLGTDSHCCTEDNKCDEYEGNCEENSHCKEGLVCGTKNCKDNWRGKMDFDANDNCCKEEGNDFWKKTSKYFKILKKIFWNFSSYIASKDGKVFKIYGFWKAEKNSGILKTYEF